MYVLLKRAVYVGVLLFCTYATHLSLRCVIQYIHAYTYYTHVFFRSVIIMMVLPTQQSPSLAPPASGCTFRTLANMDIYFFLLAVFIEIFINDWLH